jgi:cytochrome c-type biogenesis protein CcmF
VTAELGHFALVLALAVALVQSILPLVGAWTGNVAWMAIGRTAALAQAALALIAFAMLMAAFVGSDFSVINVAQNSHSLKPMLYKVAGVWGNHEGSLLLWVTILALFGAAVAIFGGNLPMTLRARILSVQGMIGIGFLLFILLTSNPFLRLDPAPIEGNGLNPLLQDPGLAFHPPLLYLGYVGFSVAFAFAVAALVEGRVDPAWARWVRPWTLVAWCFLTLGIALGSYWAYYELGWGGWWFWDPVENASFMPWLAGTALLHSAIVAEKRDALKSWTILLAIITFSLSLLGTFLVRSGVLTSVHAFATDPARGVFILIFLCIVVGGSLALYALRAGDLKVGGLFAPMSREGSLVLNNLLLATATGSVLLGTLYPLFLDALTGEKVSVGAPFFNTVFIPLMTPLIVAMAVGPLLAWKRADLAGALQRLKFAFAASVLLVLLGWWWLGDGPVLALLGLALFAWLAVGVVVEWAERIGLGRIPLRDSLNRAMNLPRAAYGMSLAHLGLALTVLGITASSAWQHEVLTIMKPGERAEVGGYTLTFEGARQVRGPNYTALQGSFAVAKDGRNLYVLQPETRRFPQPPMDTTEAAIESSLLGDLYVVIGEPDGSGGYAARLYWKPLVIWIWIGALFMAVGGFVSLSDRRLRVGAPSRRGAGIAMAPAE